MIVKYYELGNLKSSNIKFFLLHGKNDGLKNEKISELILKNKGNKVLRYDEKDIIDNKDSFYDNIFNGSLFDSRRFIIINRSSDKLLPFLEEIFKKIMVDILFVINADTLEKKSKLRVFFEKDKNSASIAFYPDTNETLIKLTQNFFNKLKISISSENINFIVNKCNNDRGYLKSELNKISLFLKDKKKIKDTELIKLINLTENFSINQLIDMCLAKNNKKTITILNENNFGAEDCILITRTFLNKSKRLLYLLEDYKNSNDVNKTISKAKPPIFWKDKDLIRKQIISWTPEKIKELIYNLNELEMLIKKVSVNPLNMVSNFIIENSSIEANN
tara:strand:- start:1665 stop:2663 length:999 start_codon:yes stop_codon:yes gene_type:complete